MRSRIKKIVKHKLQLKMVGVFLGLACICAFFQLLLINHSLTSLLQSPQLDDSTILNGLPRVLATNFLITLVVLIPLMGYIGILMTRRITEPVLRFENYLESLAAGEESRLCKIRKSDELQELCKKINAVANRYLEQNPPQVDAEPDSAFGPGGPEAAEQTAA